MTTKVEHVLVDFAGEGSGIDELSWGQRDIWKSMTRYNSSMALGGVKPLDPGTTIEDVRAELSYLVSRYQTMRTRLLIAPDGSVRQVVSASGQIPLEIIDVDGEDPQAVAEAIAWQYDHGHWDYTVDWPVRMGVLRQDGVLTHMVAIMCHLVLDGFGGAVMMREVAARESAPITGAQPLEQARWQGSAAGRRQHDSAMRYFERTLRGLPRVWVGASTEHESPRHWQGEFDSSALALALRVIAARSGPDTGPVLLTAFALAVRAISTVNPVAFRPVVSNRFRHGLADIVCPLSQHGLCVIDFDGIVPGSVGDGADDSAAFDSAAFDEAVERTRRASMTSYKYAYYDPKPAQTLFERMAEERGPGFDIDCYVNDRRGMTDGSEPPAADEIRAALPSSVMRWVMSKDDPSARLFVEADELESLVRLRIYSDTHHISLADAEALLRRTERILVAAACADDASRLPERQAASVG